MGIQTGDAGPNTLTGDDNNDVLSGLGGDDTLNGAGGRDTLDGGTGGDTMDGGTGDDLFQVDDAGDFAFEAPGEGEDRVIASVSWVMTDDQEIETLVTDNAAGVAAIDLTGNQWNNRIDGNAGVNTLDGGIGDDMLRGFGGADVLYGRAGTDTLDGGAGADVMQGGDGDDSYYVDDTNDQIVEGAPEGKNDIVRSTVSYTLSANIEALTLTGGASSSGTGNDLDNVILGNGGHNVLNGGIGADRMEGGAGDDTYHVDDANDLVIEAGVGIDKVVASASYTLRTGVTVETLTTDNDAGTAAINLNGNELANRVVGNAGANTLHGGSGNDRLEGLDGSDMLWGDAGTDLLIGGNGNDLYVVTDLGDTILETATGGTDRVSLSLATGGVFTLGSHVETLVVAGSGVEAHGNAQDNQIVNSATGSSIWGEGGNDTLIGGTLAEALHGGTGNDRITGAAGTDTMWGDAGNDLFVFASGSGADEVVDFTRGADRIDLTGYGISSLAQVQGMLSQSGANAVIDLGGGNSITLDNIVGSQLAASDFVFAPAPPAFSAMAAANVLLPSGDFLSGGGPATASVLDF